MGVNSKNSKVIASKKQPPQHQKAQKRMRMRPPPSPPNGDDGQSGFGPSHLRVQFFEGTHGAKAFREYNVDLSRHKPSKKVTDVIKRFYSDAISRHSPESTAYPVEDRFESHGQMHMVRKEYLKKFRNDMIEAQRKGILSFGFKKPFVASDGEEYVFTFRFQNGVWKEITGYPNDRRDC